MASGKGQKADQGARKISTGILLHRIASPEHRYVARELHEALLDLPKVWAPSEVFEHESISYRVKGRAFIHMAPPLETEQTEIHILEGAYPLPVLMEMAKELPPSVNLRCHQKAPHRHTKGGELVMTVTRENLQDIYRFIVRLYRRECGY